MATSLDIVVPVLNEEEDLRPSITVLHEFLSTNLDGYEWRIVVADNGSTDSTPDVAKRRSLQHKELPIHGVQFHPESIASQHGHALLKNFLDVMKVPA